MDWWSLALWVVIGGGGIWGVICRERQADRERSELEQRRRDVFRIDRDGEAHHRFVSLCQLASYLETYAADVRKQAHPNVYAEPPARGGAAGEG